MTEDASIRSIPGGETGDTISPLPERMRKAACAAEENEHVTLVLRSCMEI